MGAPMENLIVPDHHRADHLAGMNRYLKTGEKRVIGKGRIQLEARRKSGEIFPVELSISSAETRDGEVFISFARDISYRVAAERELIKARDESRGRRKGQGRPDRRHEPRDADPLERDARHARPARHG